MSTHNICFHGQIRKILTWYPLLSRPMSKKFVSMWHVNLENKVKATKSNQLQAHINDISMQVLWTSVNEVLRRQETIGDLHQKQHVPHSPVVVVEVEGVREGGGGGGVITSIGNVLANSVNSVAIECGIWLESRLFATHPAVFQTHQQVHYKDLSWVCGVDRNIHPEDHCLGSRVMPDCDCEGWIFLSIPLTHDRFFFLLTFHFWAYLFSSMEQNVPVSYSTTPGVHKC